jgi:hypothetical protein
MPQVKGEGSAFAGSNLIPGGGALLGGSVIAGLLRRLDGRFHWGLCLLDEKPPLSHALHQTIRHPPACSAMWVAVPSTALSGTHSDIPHVGLPLLTIRCPLCVQRLDSQGIVSCQNSFPLGLFLVLPAASSVSGHLNPNKHISAKHMNNLIVPAV